MWSALRAAARGRPRGRPQGFVAPRRASVLPWEQPEEHVARLALTADRRDSAATAFLAAAAADKEPRSTSVQPSTWEKQQRAKAASEQGALGDLGAPLADAYGHFAKREAGQQEHFESAEKARRASRKWRKDKAVGREAREEAEEEERREMRLAVELAQRAAQAQARALGAQLGEEELKAAIAAKAARQAKAAAAAAEEAARAAAAEEERQKARREAALLALMGRPVSYRRIALATTVAWVCLVAAMAHPLVERAPSLGVYALRACDPQAAAAGARVAAQLNERLPYFDGLVPGSTFAVNDAISQLVADMGAYLAQLRGEQQVLRAPSLWPMIDAANRTVATWDATKYGAVGVAPTLLLPPGGPFPTSFDECAAGLPGGLGTVAAALLLVAMLLHSVATLATLCARWQRRPLLIAAVANAVLCLAACVCGGVFWSASQGATLHCPADPPVLVYGLEGANPCTLGGGYIALVLGLCVSVAHAWLIFTGRAAAKVLPSAK